jgi:hypothetical protein
MLISFIKNFIIGNPWKIIFSGLFFISLFLAITLDPLIDKHQLIEQFEYNGSQQYVYQVGSQLRIESCDGTCKYPQPGDIVVIRTPLPQISFGVLAFFLLIGIVVTSMDDYNDWGLNEIYEKSLADCVKIYQKDGLYTYVLLGRVLYESKNSDWREAKHTIKDFSKNKKLFPKY